MKARLTLALLGLAAFAGANAAMGVALEQYDRRAWLAYVVLTVVFEAWAIGRWVGFAWPEAVGASIVANFVTAGCCANLCGVGLHSTFVGSRLNPNPLMNMVVMFGGFALISGGIESVVWWLFRRSEKGDGRLALRTVAAHLVWVPLGIAIMLVPSRPYPYLEGYTFSARQRYLVELRAPLDAKIAEEGRIPNYRDTRRFFREIRPTERPQPPDVWAMPYAPQFGRFATGQARGELLWEWNPAATGLRIDSKRMPETIWLLRTRPGAPWGSGLIWSKGRVEWARDRFLLGYPDAEWQPRRASSPLALEAKPGQTGTERTPRNRP